MRFALYGDEAVALGVARAVAAAPEHELTRLVGRPQSRPGLPALAPRARCCSSWEDLLADPDVDAVIIAGAAGETQQAVRQLVQSGKAVLFSPALVQPAAFFYEMALVEAESPGRLFPLLGLRGHALILKLRDLISQEALGRLRHGQLDRKMRGTAVAAQPLLSDADLDRALLGDADLLRALCGHYDQVTASRSGDRVQGYSLATVTLAGSEVPQAVWTAAATSGPEEWRLTLAGESGTAVLEGDPNRARFRLTLSLAGLPPATEECVDHAGGWLLESFAAAISDAKPPAADRESNLCKPESRELSRDDRAGAAVVNRPFVDGAVSLWSELARAVELVDAVERSVRRRRTIDVYFETPSERGIFKTQMTAVGCSLLVLTLVAVVIYLGVAAAVAIPPLVKKILVALIFVPLGVFLVMQLLFFVARPAAREGR